MMIDRSLSQLNHSDRHIFPLEHQQLSASTRARDQQPWTHSAVMAKTPTLLLSWTQLFPLACLRLHLAHQHSPSLGGYRAHRRLSRVVRALAYYQVAPENLDPSRLGNPPYNRPTLQPHSSICRGRVDRLRTIPHRLVILRIHETLGIFQTLYSFLRHCHSFPFISFIVVDIHFLGRANGHV